MTLIEKAIDLAHAELGQDRFEAGEHAMDYINAMSNYELIEFLSRILEQPEPTVSCRTKSKES